jgi:hypothetical protein
MRVWLVDDRRGEDPDNLEILLRQLVGRPETRLQLLAARPFWPDLLTELRAQGPDVVVVYEPAWPDGPWTQELLGLGASVLVATSNERCSRFRSLAETHPVWFVPPRPGADCLALALLGAAVARRRHEHWKTQVSRLQQRLNDRVVIERAKGILVQRLHITEEEAYRRLRVLSRRQRRQIRDIAQALLDAQSLFLPDNNGLVEQMRLNEPAEPPPAEP